MTAVPAALAVPVVPCRDLAAARAFWARLELDVVADHGDYLLLQGHGVEVHLRQAEPGSVTSGANPARVYLRVPEVDSIAAAFGDGLVHPPAAQPWGLREFALSDPDGALVKVGWPCAEGAA